MEKYSQELLESIAGEKLFNLTDNTTVMIKEPSMQDELKIQRIAAIEYRKAKEDGLPSFSDLKEEIKQECANKNISEDIAEKRKELTLKFVSSKEYFELSIDEDNISEKEYQKRLKNIAKIYIDEDTAKQINEYERIERKHYKQSAEYFANLEKLKALAYACVYNESGDAAFFKSKDELNTTPATQIEKLLIKLKTLIINGRGEEFFFTS